jgi:hypothetical protein
MQMRTYSQPVVAVAPAITGDAMSKTIEPGELFFDIGVD